jgi:hypothetical protein
MTMSVEVYSVLQPQTEILMAHRQDYLARHVHMLQIPINIDLFPHIHAAEAWCT